MLGISRDADAKAIKDTFRSLALKYHPDRNKEAGAEERFKEIAEAYAVLSDPKKRAEYDTGGFAGVAGFSPEDLFGGIDFEDLFRGTGLSGSGFDFGGGLFERFFGRQSAGPARGEDVRVALKIPLSRVMSGGEEAVRVILPARCDACHGTGAKRGTAQKSCPVCHGSGREVKSSREAGVSFQRISICPACHGRGSIIEKPCGECRGSGMVEKQDSLTVTVPVGVEEGMVLRIPGHGMPSDVQGGSNGDLLIVVSSAPDPRFERDGADLWRSEILSLPDAVLGVEREVPTPDGTAVVKIPPGTQPDSVLRLGGKGLPHFGGGRHGDLLLRLRVHVPERLNAEELRLYQRLSDLQHKGGEASSKHHLTA